MTHATKTTNAKIIEELQLELSQIHRNYAEKEKLQAETAKLHEEKMNFKNQIAWRPIQVALIPIVLSLIALCTALFTAVSNKPIISG